MKVMEEARAKGNLIAEADHKSIDYAFIEAKELAKALVTVWYKERMPMFSAEYRVLAVEQEVRSVLYEDDKYVVVLMSRHDAILERINDGALLQDELKTKASLNNNWVNGWEHNMQLVGQHIALQQWACDHGLGERPIGGALVETLLKGKRERDDKDGGLWKQSTPLLYAYVKRGDGFMVDDVLSHTYKRDWPKMLVSEYMPTEKWVMSLPKEVTTSKCAVITPPRPSSDEVLAARRQWGMAVIRQHEAINGPSLDLDRDFMQNTEHCFRYGKCGFYEACWNPTVGADPIGSGLYQVREPNHPEGADD